MYDKVKLWIDRAMVGEQYPSIADYLENARQETDLETGEVKTFGYLDGLRVSVFVGGVSVVGSLAKFLFDSNVYPLDRHTTARAVEKISEQLHFDISEAIVTGVEFGTGFLMRHNVQDYLCKLGDMPRLQRYHFSPSALYFKGTGKQQPKVFAFYDKIADATAKGMPYPDNMKGANLLRYEMRLNGRLAQQIKWPKVTASTLSEPAFCRRMAELYKNYYFSVSKQNQLKQNAMSEIKTVSDAFNLFVARLIGQTNQSEIGGFLDELKEASVFPDRKNYSRLKKKIQEVATKGDITTTSDLIKELDDDVNNFCAYV